jgi:Prp8 binding protein
MGHSEQVNSSFVSKKGEEIIASVSDDCSIKIWDCRQKQAAISYNFEYPLTSVVLNNSNDKAYIGSIDNQIKEFNLKQQKIESILLGHMDSITGMSLSHDGSYLLSNSMD